MKKYYPLFWLVVILCLSLSACGNPKTTNSAEGYIGTNYETVTTELKNAGFTNIEVNEVQDLTSLSDLQDGDVGKISIDGQANFSEGAKFEAEVPIIITYHTIPKLAIPLSYEDMQEYSHTDIAAMFSDAGFENVTVEEVYDLDPEIYDVEFENEIVVNGTSTFEKNERIPFDSKISVVCHRPFERYSLKVHIDFLSNLIFSTYDVILSVDGEEHTMEHGVDGDFEFNLKEGTYTISFVSAESSAIKNEVALDVNCDVEAAFEISCHSDDISVETLYIDNNMPLSDDEAKTMGSEFEFLGKNYETVIATIKEWGFTNIIEKPMYDISLGLTDEGSVGSVTIDGTDDFKRGNVFKKDAEIIVSYHMSEDDDPSKIKPPYDTESADGVNYLDVVKAFEDAGFSNVSTEKKIESEFGGNTEDTVAYIHIDGSGAFDTSDAFAPDAEIKIYYYVINESDLKSDGTSKSDGISKSDTELTSYYAQKAFEKFGEILYPYGFKCHWFMDLLNEEQLSDGSWFFKVGVTIEIAAGNKIDAVAEGIVSGTDANPKVVQFDVY